MEGSEGVGAHETGTVAISTEASQQVRAPVTLRALDEELKAPKGLVSFCKEGYQPAVWTRGQEL